MKVKNNKGITLIVLVIMIVLMLIIAGVTVYEGRGLIRETRFQDMKTNMLLIQAKAKSSLEDNIFDENNDLIGTLVGDNSSIKTNSSEDISEYYYLTKTDLEEMGLTNLTVADGEYYLVKYDKNKIDVDVLYTGGITDSKGEKTYYTLDDMQQSEK